jgi:hypothetical protein
MVATAMVSFLVLQAEVAVEQDKQVKVLKIKPTTLPEVMVFNLA